MRQPHRPHQAAGCLVCRHKHTIEDFNRSCHHACVWTIRIYDMGALWGLDRDLCVHELGGRGGGVGGARPSRSMLSSIGLQDIISIGNV